jgi:4-hydroxy-3-polyprenylbenzoate decarboxylase
MAVVGVRPAYRNIANQIGHMFNASFLGAYKVIVVEDDVDVFNMDEVLHALASKCHPTRQIKLYDDVVDPSPLNPFLSTEERRWQTGARVVFDCTWPIEWAKKRAVPPRMSFKEAYASELQERVIQNWKNYGFR